MSPNKITMETKEDVLNTGYESELSCEMCFEPRARREGG